MEDFTGILPPESHLPGFAFDFIGVIDFPWAHSGYYSGLMRWLEFPARGTLLLFYWLDIRGFYSLGILISPAVRAVTVARPYPPCSPGGYGHTVRPAHPYADAPVPLRVPTHCHVRRARSRRDLPYMTFYNLILRFCMF